MFNWNPQEIINNCIKNTPYLMFVKYVEATASTAILVLLSNKLKLYFPKWLPTMSTLFLIKP